MERMKKPIQSNLKIGNKRGGSLKYNKSLKILHFIHLSDHFGHTIILKHLCNVAGVIYIHV